MMNEDAWWFCVRAASPPGAWVEQGPFRTYDDAKAARAKEKSPGMDVTMPFVASSAAAAREKGKVR